MKRRDSLGALLGAAAFGQGRRPLIGVAGMSHESDSFNQALTTLEEFGSLKPLAPAAFVREHETASTTVSGYVEGAKRHGLDLYPMAVVGATPKGPVARAAFETIAAEIVRQVKAAPKLDGLLMPLHGAMVVEHYPSGDAELVRRVREAVGPGLPIVVTHDFHANVTPEIVRDSTVLITFKETPHIDTKDRGLQAARIMHGIVTGKVKPVQVLVKPPMVYNILYHHTKRAPLLPIVQESRRLEEDPKFLAVSVPGGYQYGDVPQVGPSVIVVTDNDRAAAEREARRLSDMLWATRGQLKVDVPPPDAAVREAMRAERFPVALVDTGDNIGGGSPGDSTFLLAELVKQKAEGWVVVIYDPEAARAAIKAGVDQPFEGLVGGKSDKMHGEPVRIRGTVRSLHAGRYVETEVRHGGGRYWNMGHTAVIEAEGSTRDMPNLLLLTMRRSSPNSLHQLISCGVYPERQKILVVKGAIAPRAAYEPVAARIIEVDTPGVTAVNPKRFQYRNVRPGLFGLN